MCPQREKKKEHGRGRGDDAPRPCRTRHDIENGRAQTTNTQSFYEGEKESDCVLVHKRNRRYCKDAEANDSIDLGSCHKAVSAHFRCPWQMMKKSKKDDASIDTHRKSVRCKTHKEKLQRHRRSEDRHRRVIQKSLTEAHRKRSTCTDSSKRSSSCIGCSRGT